MKCIRNLKNSFEKTKPAAIKQAMESKQPWAAYKQVGKPSSSRKIVEMSEERSRTHVSTIWSDNPRPVEWRNHRTGFGRWTNWEKIILTTRVSDFSVSYKYRFWCFAKRKWSKSFTKWCNWSGTTTAEPYVESIGQKPNVPSDIDWRHETNVFINSYQRKR